MTCRRTSARLLPVGRGGPALIAALLLAACGAEPAPAPAPPATAEAPPVVAPTPLPQGTLEAVALELGVGLDADGRVATPAERVRAGDAVHISLVTVGEADAAMLAVRWRDARGAEVDADERVVRAASPAVHTFTRKPEGGWAPGAYQAEVTVNGESAGVRAFEVR